MKKIKLKTLNDLGMEKKVLEFKLVFLAIIRESLILSLIIPITVTGSNFVSLDYLQVYTV